MQIGRDAEKVVVAPSALRMRSGRARRHRFGSVTEVVPVAPSGRTRQDRIRFACRLGMALLVLSAVLSALGVVWWLPAAGSVLMVALVGAAQSRAAHPGVLALPRGDDCHVLWAPQERAAYERAVVVSRRIRRTWPALAYMIDPVTADRDLTRALDQLAALMVRRQQIRRLRAELAGTGDAGLPADSPAVHAVAAQRERVEALWRATGVTANRMLAAINETASTGETLIREQRLHETARDADRALARITASVPVGATESGPELAERTAAVVAAYRELGR